MKALTPRQREVLALAAKGLTNEELAGVLGISPSTVKVHLAAIYRILEVSNRTEAATALAQLKSEENSAQDTEDTARTAGHATIAVLPFEVLGAQPQEVETWSRGLALELIDSLSRWHTFSIIAAQSSFVCAEDERDVGVIAQRLGASYVVTGTLRVSENYLRIYAQLIDGSSGHIVHTDRFECPSAEMFETQERASRALAAAIHPKLVDEEARVAASRPWSDLHGWERTIRGLFLVERRVRDSTLEGIAILEDVVASDPQNLLAAYGLALGNYQSLFLQFADDPSAALAGLQRAVERCAAIQPDHFYTRYAEAILAMLMSDSARAERSLKRALKLNPSAARAFGFLGQLLAMQGRPDEGIQLLERALELSPMDPMRFSMMLSIGCSHFGAKRYEDAYQALVEAIELREQEPLSWAMLAASCAFLGRDHEAELALDELSKVAPQFTFEGFQRVATLVHPDYTTRFERGLRLAGFEARAGSSS